MASLATGQLSDWCTFPSPCGNPKEATRALRREQNDTLCIPCAPTGKSYIRKYLNGSAGGFDTFQLSVSEEPDRAAVCRPEWIARALGTSDRLRYHGVE